MIEHSKNLAIQVLQKKISELQQESETQIAELHLAITSFAVPAKNQSSQSVTIPAFALGSIKE